MLIRLSEIELCNFKNVRHGKIKMPTQTAPSPERESASITGIFGQNGSGKTAVLDTLSFLKLLMAGASLPTDAVNYITKTADCATAVFSFFIKDDSDEYTVKYTFSLNTSADAALNSEKLVIYAHTDGRKKNLGQVQFRADSEHVILPKKRLSAIGNTQRLELEVEKRLCMRECRSFLFSTPAIQFLFSENDAISYAVRTLSAFAERGLYIVGSYNHDSTAMEFVLPAQSLSDTSACRILLTEPTVMPSDAYAKFLNQLTSMSTVMNVIIPGLTLTSHEFGREMMRDGREGVRFELMSCRKDLSVPLRYESEGIKKIISILNLLIAMYNSYCVCVVVDEMDAGVFEFLLGELLSCIEESGKGQLIFTSHNLRPLEMIAQDALVFTTTNPDNRYIRINSRDKNLRSSYLRHIMLGGLSENVYENANTAEIAFAFRKCREQVQ
ncbi:MAG: AAA family ATPase [Clostridia bacterium]|nr:AAA family ATPase [Clostridia bacterium]